MKMKIITIATVISASLSWSAYAQKGGSSGPVAPVANDHLTIEEINETLIATLGGSSVTLNLNGTTDHWSADLPGFSWTTANLAGVYMIGEPENASAFNNVAGFANTMMMNDAHFTWESDIGSGGPPVNLPFQVTVTNAGTDPAGHTFDVTFIDGGSTNQSTPDGGTTVMLFGLGLAGLAFIRRRIA